MTKPVVVAFAGRKGSGKSTAAQVLVEEMGYTDAKFAEPLKNMIRAFYRTCGVDSDTIERKIEGDLKEESCVWLQGKSPRHAMQTLGTEWRNMIGTKLWSDIFQIRVNRGDFGDKVVCSDYRFKGHEEDALENLGAYTFLVEREGVGPSDQHASELDVDGLRVRGVLHNDRDLETLREYVRELIAVYEAVGDMTENLP